MALHRSLADRFPPSNQGDWHALADAVVGRLGVDRSDDDIAVGPIYPRRRDAACLWKRAGDGRWTIVQRIAVGAAEEVHARLQDDISGGAGAIELAFADCAHPLAGGLPVSPAPDLAECFAEAPPAGFGIRIDAGDATDTVTTDFVRLLGDRESSLTISRDPIGLLAARGWLRRRMDDLTGEAAAMARRLDRPDIELLVADGRLWHAAGASEAQELAAVLASFVAHLRSLSAHGISLDRAVALVGLVLTADADQFLTIAKFRAMRLLHARIVEAAGLPPGRCRIHAETAWRMMSRRDRRANILRTTGAAFSAAVGGADSITVLPFDVLDDDPRPHARRLARNTQLVLAREAHVGATADPGAGSGAIEQLTDALAAAAWSKFQAIEAAGGMAASVRAGTLQREIAATRSGRLARVARGDIQLVGANVFPGTVEGPGPAPVRQSPRPDHPAESVEPLVFTRLSESSETGDPAATGRRSAS